MTTGAGHYFDGTMSTRHTVTVEAGPEALRILGSGGAAIGEWPYGELRAQPAPDHVMRLRRAGGPELARLEIHDPALIAEIDTRADSLDRTGGTERRLRKRVIGWSIAATVSLVLVAVFGLPALSDRLAPLIPLSVERRLGDAVDT
ncbi:MAG: metalloendopeptidase, partial [Xanthobacteraceae bacterium]|nr:metalloendopeptidase [Xanthobacteraceae bacterium]